MGSGALVGALAIFTIGAALVGGITYLAIFLRDPRNREQASNVVNDGKAASTKLREKAGANERGTAPLKERLNNSEASQHPDDPTRTVAAPR